MRAAPPRPARRERLLATVVNLVNLIRSSDEAAVEKAILQLSESRRWLAPLALIIGAFLLLFRGLKLLVTNWRLTLVQIVPAMWIWAALLDIKIHLLHGREFHVIRGPILIPCFIAITGITAASFYLNGVFAFAISDNDGATPDPPGLRQGERPSPDDPGLGRRHRAGPVLLDADLVALGPPVVRPVPGDRGRRHDDLLPGGAGPHGGRDQDQEPA